MFLREKLEGRLFLEGTLVGIVFPRVSVGEKGFQGQGERRPTRVARFECLLGRQSVWEKGDSRINVCRHSWAHKKGDPAE